ncbi:MAG: ABC transporter substrate-binding protein [Brevinema sp.]
MSCGENTSDTRLVKHTMGYTRIPKAPQRVVALTGEAVETLLALGIKPVGAVSSCWQETWYPHLADQMQGVVLVGDEKEVDLQKIADLQPDLIIGVKGRQDDTYSQLNAIAPTLYLGDNSRRRHRDWKRDFLAMSDILGYKKQGQKLLATWTTNMLTLSGRLKESGDLDRTTALYRFTGKTARYYGNLGFASSIVNDLGFKRSKRHNKNEFNFEVTEELISNMNAEQAFYFVFGDKNIEQSYQFATNFLTNEQFKILDHKAERIYEVNNNIWNKSYGIIAAQLVLDEIEGIFLKK